MYSLLKYNKDNILLAKSITVKLTDIAIAINKGLVKQHGLKISNNPKTWKYYMNLAGIRHETNSPVLVNVLELGEKQLLSKELLDTYNYTRTELLKYGQTFNNLIDEYPEDIMFIKGCLHPVDIDVAIKAKEGTILSYNHTFVEAPEFSLMRELQVHVYDFLSRWHIKEYTLVDDLYLPVLIGNLYNSIVLKIMNIRLEKIHTNEAHSFHLEHFFRSNLNLWTSISIVNDETKYWLYKNLGWLIRNIGRQEAFDVVIKKILNKNNVGLGMYQLRKPNNIVNEKKDIMLPTFINTPLIFNNIGLNSYYHASRNSSISLDTILNKELNLENIKDEDMDTQTKYRNNTIVETSVEKINKTHRDNQITKVLEISTYQLFKRHGLDLFKLLLDYFVSLTIDKKINYLAEFVDPNDNQNYILTAENAILFIVKMLLSATGQLDAKIKSIPFDYVLLRDKEELREVYKRMFRDGIIDCHLEDLIEHYPNVGKYCNTSNDVLVLMNEVQEFYSYLWTLDSNTESSIGSANVKMLSNFITRQGELVFTDDPEGKTIDELMFERNIKYTITNKFDVVLSLTEIIKLFTGVSIDEAAVIKEITTEFKVLVDRLTSYSTQVLNTSEDDEDIFIHYNNTNIFNSLYGIANITDARLRGLEENYVYIDSLANNFSDDCEGYNLDNINIKTFTPPKKPIFGIGTIKDNKHMYDLAPRFAIEVNDTNRYGINRVEYKQKFIPELDMSMDTMEYLDPTLKSGSNTITDVSPISSEVYNNPIVIDSQSAKLPETPIVGVAYNSLNKDISTPTVIASIEQDPKVSITKGNYKNVFLLDVSMDMESIESEEIMITSGANTNNDEDTRYGSSHENPLPINATQGQLREHPIVGTSEIYDNQDTSIFAPVVRVTMNLDEEVPVTKGEYSEVFIKDVSMSLEPNEDITVSIDTTYNDNTKEDVKYINIESNSLIIESEDAVLPTTPIEGTAYIAQDIGYSSPTLDVRVEQDPKVSVDKGVYKNEFLPEVTMSMPTMEELQPVIKSGAMIDMNTGTGSSNDVTIEPESAARVKPIDGSMQISRNNDVVTTEPQLSAELIPDPVVHVLPADQDDYDDLEDDNDILTPIV